MRIPKESPPRSRRLAPSFPYQRLPGQVPAATLHPPSLRVAPDLGSGSCSRQLRRELRSSEALAGWAPAPSVSGDPREGGSPLAPPLPAPFH